MHVWPDNFLCSVTLWGLSLRLAASPCCAKMQLEQQNPDEFDRIVGEYNDQFMELFDNS